jgi:hypothetical protein
MDYTVFRAALRASAKVAFTATIASCGGAIQSAESREANDAAVDASTVSDPVADAALAPSPRDGTTSPTACSPPSPASLAPEAGGSVQVTDDTFQCCIALIAPELRTDAIVPRFDDAAASDPAIVGCCDAVIYRLDHDYSGDAGAADRAALADAGLGYSEYAGGCCPVVAYPEGPTCTPWGPPMPPAMPEVA